MHTSHAQMTVNSGFTPLEYVQELVGPGITVSNVVMTNNSDNQIGIFDGQNSNIGFIGLGNMGKPIFDHLNKKFSNIFCFDQDKSKLKKNNFSSSLIEIFEKCKIIIFCIE